MPGVGRRHAREEQLLRIPVQLHVDDRAPPFRLVHELRLAGLRAAHVEEAQLVVVAIARQHRVALPVARQVLASVLAADEEQPVEAHRRIEVDHQPALQRVEACERLLGRLNCGKRHFPFEGCDVDGFLHILHLRGHFVNLRRELWIGRPAVRDQAVDRREGILRTRRQALYALTPGEVASLHAERAAALTLRRGEPALCLEAHCPLRHGEDDARGRVGRDETRERLVAHFRLLGSAPVHAVAFDLAPSGIGAKHRERCGVDARTVLHHEIRLAPDRLVEVVRVGSDRGGELHLLGALHLLRHGHCLLGVPHHRRLGGTRRHARHDRKQRQRPLKARKIHYRLSHW